MMGSYSFQCSELNLIFNLMNHIPGGVKPILDYLEAHIISTGLADMKAHADTITTVRKGLLLALKICYMTVM